MNLDDMMAVWQSQDAAPLHGVDKTRLHQALRQDEATLLAQRRRERWREYFGAAGAAGIFAFFLTQLIYPQDDDVLIAWDYAIPIVGMVAVLFSMRAMYVSHRAQARREQRFGESLRDQINRQISQLDFWATRVRRVKVWGEALLSVVGATTIVLVLGRINDRPFSDVRLWRPIVFAVLGCAFFVAAGFWRSRRRLQREVLPLKRRLEALLKELDGQD